MQKDKQPILLTSMPKAGTYFFAEILSQIGAENRHLHVARHHAENLLLFDDEVNKQTPSKAKVPLELDQALYTVQGGEFVFGHIAKPLLEEFFLKRFKIIYCHRDARDAMQAEFYWFRELRKDMLEKFTQYNHLSAEEHFIKYLEMFGNSRIRLFNFLDMWREDPAVVSVDFDLFRRDQAYAQERIQAIAQHIDMPVSEQRAAEILDACLNADTKTKTQRDTSVNLWTPEAEKLYEKLQSRQGFYNFIYPIYWKLRGRRVKAPC